jgi:hypothetical protein
MNSFQLTVNMHGVTSKANFASKCIKMYQFCINMYQFCIKMYQFCIKMYQFCIKMYQFWHQNVSILHQSYQYFCKIASTAKKQQFHFLKKITS